MTSTVGFLSLRRARPYGVIPTLDADVIGAVCGLIDDIYDLLSVSLTCSAMWRIAIRQLLMTHTIHLKTRRAIRGFRKFILNRRSDCAHQVHAIAVPEVAWIVVEDFASPDDVGQLMDILDCTVNLGSLQLSLGNVYADSARISSAFAGMSILTHLSIADPGLRWAPHALSALHSPLRTLCMGIGNGLTFVPSPPGKGFFQAISRLSASSTLTTLHLDRIPVYDNSSVAFPQFRFVKSLSIIKPLEHVPRLDTLLYLFPSLDGTLRLRLNIAAKLRLSCIPRRRVEIRERNRCAQDVSRWTRIDRLDCGFEIADMLALQCPVRHLTVDSFDLKAIIGIQPKHLVVTSIKLPFYLSPQERRAQPPAAGSRPTHVVLIMLCHAKDYLSANTFYERPVNSGWDASLERLIRALSLFENVTHVRLVFYCNKEDLYGEEAEDFMRELYERVSAETASELLPAAQLLAACPKLRFFFITAAGWDDTRSAIGAQRRWIRDRAWRVVEIIGEGGRYGSGDTSVEAALPMLEELSEYAARRVIEAEDLGLPEKWERKLEACRI